MYNSPDNFYLTLHAIGLVMISLLAQSCDTSRTNDTIADDPSPHRPKNFVVLLTDDQPASTLWAMPILQDKLASRGITFTEAIATNPECCPFRASALSGGYHSYNTGVLRNSSTNGAIKKFKEDSALPVVLQNSGYRTGFVGRYMHGYQSGHVPPGWDTWVANSYYNYTSYNQLKSVTFFDKERQNPPRIEDVDQYVTDFHAEQALEFLSVKDNRPFFLWVGFFAPHSPFYPASEDDGSFSDYIYPKTQSHDEDASDKPKWIQSLAAEYRASKNLQYHSTNLVPRKQLELLQSVDRAVGKIVDKLESLNATKDTVVIFTSDNGLTYGHHSIQADKGLPYEESIKVPFVMSWANAGKSINNELVAANLDIGATLYDLAGLEYMGDGISLAKLINDPEHEWRNELFIENYGYLEWRTDSSPIWAGIKSKNYKYIEHASGEVELYNLLNDPQELENLSHSTDALSLITSLSEKVNRKAGLAIVDFVAPDALLNERYLFAPRIFGGTPPFIWAIEAGDLPAGLSLDVSSGIISGTPISKGSFSFTLITQGERKLTYTGDREKFRRRYTINVED